MQVKRLFVIITVLFSLLLPNLSQAQRIVSIPDKNLATAIRQEIGNSITTDTLLNLKRLEVPNRGITDLTGLEHAHNLEGLNLGGDYIDGKEVNSNTISDFTPIAGLTSLKMLFLHYCSLSDVSFLAKLTQLTWLRLDHNTITDISPLANLTKLNELDLHYNTISDIAPLANLTKLTWLRLLNNNISDISVLANFTELTWLRLDHNTISDISPLANLTKLTNLVLSDNTITDISPLANLTKLTWLSLHYNNISDISVLADFTELTSLDLSLNNISDISPLANLTKLILLRLRDNNITDIFPLIKLNLKDTQWNSTGLYIEHNPLNYASINRYIPAMQAKGVEIKFTNRVPTTLMKVSGIAQQGVVNTTLPLPFVVEVLDAEGQAFADVPVKFAIAAGGGKLSATTVRTDATGKASAHLRMRRTVGTTTVRVTAADISQPVQFTATAILHSAPVPIPDANLRMKIMETLRKPLDDTPTATDMLKLTTLTANNADILDLTGLQHAANLTTLSLMDNNLSDITLLVGLTQLTTLDLRNNQISDVSPLVGLAQLTTLDLRDNWISDVSPLVELTQSTGAKDWDALYLQGNPVSDTSVHSHIPVLQSAGVDVRFDDRTLMQSGPIVRLIYFLPSDRQVEPDINANMDRVIKEVQQHYANEMEKLGYGKKTFKLETYANGEVVVHHVKGKFNDAHYRTFSKIAEDLSEQYDLSENVYFVVANTDEGFESGVPGREPVCGLGGYFTLVRSFDACFTTDYGFVVVAHELGHTFGLPHDFHNDAYLMSYGGGTHLSPCAAKWLDAHSAFNSNQPVSTAATTIEMLPPSLASPPNAIRLRFKVTDPDGLHQVQLLTETLSGAAKGQLELIACKHLNSKSSHTVDFVTTALGPENESVSLQVIDKNGSMSWSRTYSADVASILPPSEVVSIPDANLAAAIRKKIGDSITTRTILNLIYLTVPNRGITDLTGLEHAHNLKELYLGGEYIEGKYVNSNTISNFSPLAGLTNLKTLSLSHLSLTDVSPLAEFTQLESLSLHGNSISDISPLAGLTQLKELSLGENSISDVSPLAEFTQLESLGLNENRVSDISPLAGLTQLKELYLRENSISDVSPLAGLTQLGTLWVNWNSISDISPLAGLTRLKNLILNNNSISDVYALEGLGQLDNLHLNDNDIADISPLVELNLAGGLWGSSIGLYIDSNPLNHASIHTHIPAMQAKGIEVEFDNVASPALLKISGDQQEGTVGEALPKPFVVEAMDALGKPIGDVPVTFVITTGGGRLSATTATTNMNGRTQTTLMLGQTPGKYTIRVRATGIQSSVIFTATATAPPIYWIRKNNGTLHRSQGTTVKNLVPSVRNATSLVLDMVGGKLYWTQQTSSNTGKIQRANLDGSNVELVKELTSVPHGLAIDPINNKLYLTNAWGKIQRLNFDGSNFQSNLITGLDAPKSVVLDVMKGKLYWIEQTSNTTGTIQSANLDGSNVQIVQKLTSAPRGLALDTVNGKLYLTNAWGKIQRLNLDGSNFEPNFITGLDSPEGIAVDTAKGKLYWTEMNSIKYGNLSGENVQEVVAGLGRPTSIALTIVPVEPVIAAAPARLSVPPTTTDLLPNYPNPFNPETWIPYQLAEPAEVTLTIYGVDGRVVRRLALGHQPVGTYHGKSRAAYWDGRNAQGERVASGVYFYTFTAGDFTATRKMLIRK